MVYCHCYVRGRWEKPKLHSWWTLWLWTSMWLFSINWWHFEYNLSTQSHVLYVMLIPWHASRRLCLITASAAVTLLSAWNGTPTYGSAMYGCVLASFLFYFPGSRGGNLWKTLNILPAINLYISQRSVGAIPALCFFSLMSHWEKI